MGPHSAKIHYLVKNFINSQISPVNFLVPMFFEKEKDLVSHNQVFRRKEYMSYSNNRLSCFILFDSAR